jgi:hypothetical protein
VAGDVSEDGEGAGDHDGRHDGEAVEAVGQIDRVAGADNHEIGQRDETDDAERIGNGLEEGDDQLRLGAGLGRVGEEQRGAEAEHRLPEIFPAGRQALRVAVNHLLPVVVPADDAEAERDDEHGPHILVAEIAPEQRGETDGNEDQDAAHGRRAGFDEMGLRAVVAYRLADLLGGQPADDARAGGEGNEQRSHRRQHGTQRDVVEDVEKANVLGEPLGQGQQHQCFSSGAASASATLSIFMKRDPFTSTVVSGPNSLSTAAISLSTLQK